MLHASGMLFPRRSWVWPLNILAAGFLLWGARGGAQQNANAYSYRQTVLAIQQQIQANRLEDARALLTAAFRRYPSDGGLENLLGIVEIEEGHTDRAKRAFSEAILHSPRLSGAYLNLARIDMETAATNAGDREAALRLYEKTLAIEPENAEANYNAALLLMWEKKYALSLQRLEKMDPESRKQVRVELLVCTDDAALGNRDAASEAAANLAAAPDLTEQDAMTVLPVLRETRRADLIDELFSAVNRRQPLSAAGLRILGLAEEAEGKPQEARATLERVFAMDPSNAAPLVDLTRIALNSKDYKGALGYLAHARALRPDDSNLAYEFGVICVRMGLLGEATRAMGEALKMAPDNAEYNYGMGTVSSYGADPSQALPYLKKFHQLRPEDPAGDLALGIACFRSKDFDTASSWLQQAAKSSATAASARYYLGRILGEQAKYSEAVAELTESNQLKPNQPEVLAHLGQVYLQMRNYPEAEKYLDRAIALDANSYAANFALLQLYAFNHDPRRAEQAKKFQAIRGETEEENREAMRVIEIRPQDGSAYHP